MIPAPVQIANATQEFKHVLLALTNPSNANSRNPEFSVDLKSEEYKVYVGGHAVLAEPLCPAPLYVELVSRAAMILLREVGLSEALLPCVEDLEIKAPLSMAVDRSASLHLSRVDDKASAWTFDMSSAEQGNAEGVRSIYERRNEFCGTVKLPVDGRSIFQDHITNPLAVDNFVQVAGLHVSCLNECEADEVFVCTKVERIQPSPQFKQSKSWMVYSSFTATGERRVETKELVLMVLGAHFMRVLIRSLAKVLARANVSKASIEDAASTAPAETNSTKPDQASFFQEHAKADVKNIRDEDVATDIFDETTLDDLGIDSLMMAEVMTEICTFFESEISAADFATLLDVMSLRTYLVARGCGRRANHLLIDSSSGSEVSAGSVAPAFTTATSAEDLTSLNTDIAANLAKLVEGHLETTVDMSLLDGDSTFGDLLDMVVPQTQSVAPTVKPTSQPVNTSTKPSAKLTVTPVASTLEPSPNRPASLQGAQQAFEDIRFDYDIFTKRTGFAGFWKKVYPARARCLLAYTVEAFATLGCKLSSMRTGQRLPPVQSLSKHDMLMRQLEEVLKDASLVKSDGVGLTRPDVPVDPTRSETLFTYILNAFPHHADEHRLLHVTASKLAECLTGTADPLWRSFSEARRTKRFWKMSITKLLASFFQRAYKTNQEGAIFHILELGGGTGGTTKYIVDFLEKLGIRFTYTFTDLAGSLVTAAKKRFAGKDFMEFNVVDIEKQPRMESLNKYHTIISTNCIHATRNLQISGNNIRQVLRPDGFVSLVEFTRNMFWFDLVFGLLEGWWLFEDGREHVLASETFWDRSLRDSGFKHVTWTDGRWEEARTLRIITAFAAEPEHEAFKPKPKTVSRKMEVETVT
ncbi:MAG: hypothetical protein Q9186_005360 [Xanthomendoza sp. 1 TL-2023]